MLVAVVCVVAAAGVAVGRPQLHNKLAHRRAQLGESVAAGELERLRVVAQEREGVSLADQFASDVAAHAVAKDALKAAAKADAEATAGLDVAVQAEVVADTEGAQELDMDVAQAVEETAEAEETGAADDKKKAVVPAKKADGKKKAAKKQPAKAKAKVAAKPVAAKKPAPKLVTPTPKAEAPKTTTLADGTKWSSCLAANAKGQTTLSAVAFKAAPPLREQSYVIEIDGSYKGADVTYGSVTMQIVRVKPHPAEAAVAATYDEVVYEHSVVLSDVLMYNPFTAANPLSATMYIPEAAFSRMAPAGDYALTVQFTNQDKEQFACTKVEFKLA